MPASVAISPTPLGRVLLRSRLPMSARMLFAIVMSFASGFIEHPFVVGLHPHYHCGNSQIHKQPHKNECCYMVHRKIKKSGGPKYIYFRLALKSQDELDIRAT